MGFEAFVRAFTSKKALFFYGVSLISGAVIAAVVTWLSSLLFKHYVLLGLGWGTALWLYGNGRMLRFFMVSVPEVTGLVTVNFFTGEMKSYGTGLHFRFPWEQVKVGNYINLRTMKTDDRQETFPCEDGPVVTVKWSLQYRSSVEQLTAYIAVDEETINRGLNEVASSFLALQIRAMESEHVREKSRREVLEQDLFKHFQESATVPVLRKDGTRTPLEDFYGIRIMLVAIADVDFEADYQKARTTQEVMRRFKETAEKVVRAEGDGSITSKEALDSVLMVAGKGVKKDISQETKVLDVSPTLARVLDGLAQAITQAITQAISRR